MCFTVLHNDFIQTFLSQNRCKKTRGKVEKAPLPNHPNMIRNQQKMHWILFITVCLINLARLHVGTDGTKKKADKPVPKKRKKDARCALKPSVV